MSQQIYPMHTVLDVPRGFRKQSPMLEWTKADIPFIVKQGEIKSGSFDLQWHWNSINFTPKVSFSFIILLIMPMDYCNKCSILPHHKLQKKPISLLLVKVPKLRNVNFNHQQICYSKFNNRREKALFDHFKRKLNTQKTQIDIISILFTWMGQT